MNQKLTDQIKITLMDLLAEGAGLEQLCNRASEFLEQPLAVAAIDRTILARSGNYTRELAEEYSGCFPVSSQQEALERVRYIDEKLALRHAFVITFPMLRYPHVVCGCFRESNMLGMLDVPVTGPRKNMQAVVEMLEFLAPYFQLSLRLNKDVIDRMTFSMQMYLSGLLNGNPVEWVHTHRLYDS